MFFIKAGYSLSLVFPRYSPYKVIAFYKLSWLFPLMHLVLSSPNCVLYTLVCTHMVYSPMIIYIISKWDVRIMKALIVGRPANCYFDTLLWRNTTLKSTEFLKITFSFFDSSCLWILLFFDNCYVFDNNND